MFIFSSIFKQGPIVNISEASDKTRKVGLLTVKDNLKTKQTDKLKIRQTYGQTGRRKESGRKRNLRYKLSKQNS